MIKAEPAARDNYLRGNVGSTGRNPNRRGRFRSGLCCFDVANHIPRNAIKPVGMPGHARIRAMRYVVLVASYDIPTRAVGSYMFDLLDKASAAGVVLSAREMAKQGDIYVRASRRLGEFRIDVEGAEFAELFTSRADL